MYVCITTMRVKYHIHPHSAVSILLPTQVDGIPQLPTCDSDSWPDISPDHETMGPTQNHLVVFEGTTISNILRKILDTFKYVSSY